VGIDVPEDARLDPVLDDVGDGLDVSLVVSRELLPEGLVVDGLDPEFEHGERERLPVGLLGIDDELLGVLLQAVEGVLGVGFRHPVGEPPDHPVEKGKEEFLLGVVVVVKQGFGLVELVGDVLHGEVRVPVFAQRPEGRAHDRLTGVRRLRVRAHTY
jgi:hypothetical protein